jgi:sugar O-acyltransferase (sialic acid O-acetyltransferase NeuD family)
MTPAITTPLVLVGGGGHALVVGEAAGMLAIPLAGVLDDRADAPAIRRLSLAHLGRLADPVRADGCFILCLGEVSLRASLLASLAQSRAAPSAPVVSPGAYVSPTARLSPGVFVGPRAVVHSFAEVGAHAIINTGAIIEHDCVVGENTHVAPGAILAGGASTGANCLLGVGCRVLPGVRIGDRCTVGAGAVVIKDIPDDSRVAGVPARPI